MCLIFQQELDSLLPLCCATLYTIQLDPSRTGRSLIDAALELVEVEEARGDGVSVEDPSFEGVDGLYSSIL